MFGIKLKQRPTEEKELQIQEEQKIENTPNQTEETVNLTEPVLTSSEDKFSLAGLLGKTEDGMKSDFYAYQIKELMKAVGIILPRTCLTVSDVENLYNQALKYGGRELLIPPYFYGICKNFEEKFGKEKVNFSALIDYPYGESSFKARLNDVKESVKNGASQVTVVMSKRAVCMGTIYSEKSNLNKLCKVGKGKVGIAISADMIDDDLRKAVKVIDGLKASHVALLAEGFDLERVIEIIKIITSKKTGKKIHVYSSVDTITTLSILMETKVDKVYTEHFAKIGRELEEKFGVEL